MNKNIFLRQRWYFVGCDRRCRCHHAGGTPVRKEQGLVVGHCQRGDVKLLRWRVPPYSFKGGTTQPPRFTRDQCYHSLY